LVAAQKHTSSFGTPIIGVRSSSTNKFWQGLSPNQDRLALKFSQQFSIHDTVARALARRIGHVSEIESYTDPKLSDHLFDPFLLPDMKKAAWRLFEAIVRKERISFIFSPSASTLSSCALYSQYLNSHQLKFSFCIINYKTDGYSPSGCYFRKLARNHSLIICVGCGTNLHFDYKSLKDTDVIAIDNAISTEFLPNLHALVNNNRFDADQKYSYLGITGLSYLFLEATNQLFRENDRPDYDLSQNVDLVSIGTTTENLPMVGLNRAFIREGIDQINQRKRLGINQLCDELALNRKVNGNLLSTIVNHCLCSGEIADPFDLGLQLLNANGNLQAQRIAKKLVELYQTTKDLKQNFLEKSISNAWQRDTTSPLVWATVTGCPTIILKQIAQDISRLTNRTTLIFGIQNSVVVAHGHSILGVNLGVIIARCINEGLVISGGGNSHEVKFDVHLKDVYELIEFITSRVSEQKWRQTDNNIIKLDGIMYASGVSLELVKSLSVLEPFGIGSPRPRLAFPYHKVISRKKLGEDSLRLTITDEFDASLEAFVGGAFKADLIKFLTQVKNERVHLAGYCSTYHRSGRVKPVLYIEDAAIAA